MIQKTVLCARLQKSCDVLYLSWQALDLLFVGDVDPVLVCNPPPLEGYLRHFGQGPTSKLGRPGRL